MRSISLIPHGFACDLNECPPGYFIFDGSICFKSQYGPNEIYCDTGEAFWGGVNTVEEKIKLIVQPLILEIEE